MSTDGFQEPTAMHPNELQISNVRLRPQHPVRLVEHAGRVTAYRQPHRTPVLPGGWAPLNGEEQDAVLRACDAAPEGLLLRLGSVWEPSAEYRVYRLAADNWAGLSVIARTTISPEPHRNVQLLGLAGETLPAVRIALDFYNWDLESHGQEFRLALLA